MNNLTSSAKSFKYTYLILHILVQVFQQYCQCESLLIVLYVFEIVNI